MFFFLLFFFKAVPVNISTQKVGHTSWVTCIYKGGTHSEVALRRKNTRLFSSPELCGSSGAQHAMISHWFCDQRFVDIKTSATNKISIWVNSRACWSMRDHIIPFITWGQKKSCRPFVLSVGYKKIPNTAHQKNNRISRLWKQLIMPHIYVSCWQQPPVIRDFKQWW